MQFTPFFHSHSWGNSHRGILCYISPVSTLTIYLSYNILLHTAKSLTLSGLIVVLHFLSLLPLRCEVIYAIHSFLHSHSSRVS